MELKITIGKAEFNKSKLGSEKECVIVEFPNCISTTTNKSFKWMPTYAQLDKIIALLKKVELESWNNKDKEIIPKEVNGGDMCEQST